MTSISNLPAFTNFLDQHSHIVVEGGVLHRATLAQRIKMSFSKSYRTQQENAIVEIATRLLKEAPRVTPRQAYKGRDVYILRRWMGRHKNAGTELQKKTFKTELTAYRFGITAENLNASVGLEQFTETKGFLYNYLAKYRHTLKVADNKSQVQILMDNKYVDWSEAKAAVADQPDAPGVWPWKYTKSGLKNTDLSTWTEADLDDRTFQRDKYKVPGQYLFSYCVYSSSKGPRYSGDHAWLRLITPEGKIYEFGKYRPPGVGGGCTALINYPATMQSPDYSTMWPTPPKDKRNKQKGKNNPPLKNTDGLRRTKIHFAITEESFKNAKEKIVELQNKKQLTFGLFDKSCVVFCNEIAELCGIKIDTSASVIKLHLPPRLMRMVDRITQYVPNIVLKVAYYIPGVLTNIATSILMGGMARSNDGKRYISSICDLLNPNKSFLHHPWYLGTEIKRKVEESRPADNLKYGIPAQFRV